ncbi:MAG TPA: substrate-binding domain-containing protein [Candidatus Eisenbacteria bacterium]|nr:substrate-binding domain-containing protein [Candidatus Eisenbacteria bacterium]
MSGIDRVRFARIPGAALVFVALVCGTCSSPSPPRKSPSAPLTLAGAEYLEPFLRAEILAFRDRYPDSDSIRVVANGSAEGMEQLVNGEVSMSLLLRELTDPEVEAAVQREGLQAFPVAWDAVAVIVNPASPIQQISRTELADVYAGRTTDWSSLGWRAGGEMIAMTVGPRLALYAFLSQTLLGGEAYAKTVYAPPTEEDVVETVATRTNAIGCVSRPHAERAGSRVRVLSVSQARGLPYVALNKETLVTRSYPLLRTVSIATPAEPLPTSREFITFVSDIEGQRIAVRHGYAPATVPIKIVRTAEEEE